MNDELENVDCKTCSRYASLAYFCLERKIWIFPEDVVSAATCEFYNEIKSSEHVCNGD
jgi:hypothetical protein